MKTTSLMARAFVSVAVLVLGACGAVVSPTDDGRGGDASGDAADAGVCRAPDGRVLHAGESYQLECNRCYCMSNGSFACTGLGCVDSGPPQCTASSQCAAGSMCLGPPGCGTPWTCRPQQGCTADYSPFCSCNGATVYGSSSCPPEPYLHTGPCETFDAGSVCDGAFRTPGGLCLGPADQPLPPYCCGDVDAGDVDATGSLDCNPIHVLCNALPGPCPGGQVRAVVGGCWGECVPYTDCVPIPCDPAGPPGQCPVGLACWGSGVCGPYIR